MSLASKWQELVTENPMLIEIQRYRRRFFSFSGSSSLNSVVLSLAIVCYAGILMLVFSSRGAIPPIAIVMFQTFLFTLVTPSMMYGAIAGEREKRTWDLLIAAPITQAQIVVGKFLGALSAIGIGYALLLFPILISAIEYEKTNWMYLFQAELVSLTFAILLSSVTLFFSARTRRSFMALGTVLAIVALSLLVVPLMLSSFLMSDMGFVNFFHPFYAQAMLLDASETSTFGAQSSRVFDVSAWGAPQTFAYLLLSVIFVSWAAKTLTFAENDIKFIPKTHA